LDKFWTDFGQMSKTSNCPIAQHCSSDINNSDINNNVKNEIRIQRWNSVSTRVEDIRKYLEANKINLNNLIINKDED
jgi:hypothetical protein